MSKKKAVPKRNLPRYLLKCLVVGAILCVLGTGLFFYVDCEHTITQYPEPTSYFFVNDYSGVLTQETEEWIQAQAVSLYEKTKAQIVVVMAPDTPGSSLEDFSYQLAKRWGIGDAKLDNGVLLLFTTEEPHVRLEIGRGLEGCLNDSKCGRILDKWAVEDKDDHKWNRAAINTWVATAKVVYEEYGLEAPAELAPAKGPSEDAKKHTMADAEFPAAIIEKNTDPIRDRLELAFLSFLLVGTIPYLGLCILFWFAESPSKGGGGSGGGYYGGWGSGGGGWSSGGGGFSGGGGDFGGGGASR